MDYYRVPKTAEFQSEKWTLLSKFIEAGLIEVAEPKEELIHPRPLSNHQLKPGSLDNLLQADLSWKFITITFKSMINLTSLTKHLGYFRFDITLTFEIPHPSTSSSLFHRKRASLNLSKWLLDRFGYFYKRKISILHNLLKSRIRR